MSKQPYVWVVEISFAGKWHRLPQYAFYTKGSGRRYVRKNRGIELNASATYRVAKYVRVEPKKVRKT